MIRESCTVPILDFKVLNKNASLAYKKVDLAALLSTYFIWSSSQNLNKEVTAWGCSM